MAGGDMSADPQREQISALRSIAHPLRLRILSLLTAEAMSAAEVARELDVTHANASYHLRVLQEAGEIVEAGEERIRGGVAKRYRYPVGSGVEGRTSPPTVEDRLAWAHVTHTEVVRRLASHASGPASDSDLEAWVEPRVWRAAMDLMTQATMLLHESAHPPRTPGTIHVSATTQAFVMGEES